MVSLVASGCAGEPEPTGSTLQALTPTGTKTVWVPTPNTPTFATGAWSRTGCTPVTPTTATLTVSPVHGGTVTLSAASFNDPSCPGVSFPGQAAFFQYPTPMVLPGSGDDMFQVQFSSSVGTVIMDVTIFEGVTGKSLGRQNAPPCSLCQASDGSAISEGDIDAVSTDESPLFASGAASDGHAAVGAPIELGTGNVFYAHTDYRTAGPNPLTFARSYNSEANANGFPVALSGTLSPSRHWRTNYDRALDLLDPTVTVAERPDGKLLNFSLVGGAWTPDSDVDYTLTHSGASWTLGCPDGSTETYTTSTASTSAVLNTIKARNGYTRTMTYTGALLTKVTDSYSRSLTMTYHGDGTLATMTTPDATTFTYSFDGIRRLQFVNSPVDPPGGYTYQYLYGNTSLPYALTGVLDRYGEQLQAWTYDGSGRAVTSARGDSSLNADLVMITYPMPGATTTVTNAQGVTDTYGFTTLQGVPKLTGISRAATTTTAAATESFGYDASGYLNSRVDWNGNHTTWVNNSHGLPTAINEAVGTAAARSATITYDASLLRLPRTIVRPGVTRSFTYDAAGDVLTDTLTDTTSQTVPYSTKGQTRTTTFTWSNSLPASIKTPGGNTTTFTFNTAGALTRITDALGHATTISSVSGGGYPLTVVDPNGVTTTLTYDGEMRPTSSTIAAAAGALTTSCVYWFSSLLFSVTLPDRESLSTSPDTAQRAITYVDAPGNRILLTLDALGNATATDIQDASHTLQRHDTASYDALGRPLTRTGVTGQTTSFTWDRNGNPLTAQDGLGHTTARAYDALDRPTTTTDADGGVVTVTYDALNRPLTVTDALGHVTSHVWDGFGDLIQRTSPDSGTTVFRYDPDGNLTQQTDATGVVTNQTFDALDRVVTTTYPADPSLNVTSTYDQTGTGSGFGIGRLTSVTDAAGTVTRSYDERGNLLAEKRVSGGAAFTTAYGYDGASHVSSVTYPFGAVSSYTRDLTGNVTSMPFAAGGADMDHSLWSVQHLPFGPVSFINYNNGDLAFYTYDRDYRLTQLSYQTFQHVPYFQWSYGYDSAGNLSSVTDALTSANSQSYGYDVLNRLTSQTSVNYGNAGWTYDRNGNLTAYTAAGVNFTLGLASGTNRVATLTGGGQSRSYGYTATGNLNSITSNGATVFSGTYSKANRLTAISGVASAVTGQVYDASGRRFSKTAGGVTSIFLYGLHGELLEENIGGTVTDYLYMDGVNVANWSPGQHHLYAIDFDRVGVPQVSRDEFGLTNWAARTGPYGQMTVTTATGQFTGPVTENLRLPGQRFDAETGFHQNGFRDYMPDLGRYLEADPIGLAGGLNPYLYARGNPGGFTDPSGLSPEIAPPSWFWQTGTVSYGNNSYPLARLFGFLHPPNCYGSALAGSDNYGLYTEDANQILKNEYTEVTGQPVQPGDVIAYYTSPTQLSHLQKVTSIPWIPRDYGGAWVHTIDGPYGPIYNGPAAGDPMANGWVRLYRENSASCGCSAR